MLRATLLLITAVFTASFIAAQDAPPAPVPIKQDGGEEAMRREEAARLRAEEARRHAESREKATPVVTRPVAPGAPAPKVHCEEPSFNFGEAAQSEEIVHDFEIVNVGEGELEIVDAKGDCGCTAVAPPNKRFLKKGESATINARLTAPAAGAQQVLSKNIRVTTNDPATPVYTLTMTGRIAQPFRIEVPEVNVGTVKKGQPVPVKTFDIATSGSQSFLDIKTDSDHVKAVYEPIPADENKTGYRVTVTITGDLKVGQLRSLISITTTLPSQKTLQVPVIGMVEGEVTLLPRTHNFGNLKVGEGATKAFDIRKSGAADLKIESLTVKPEGAFTAKVEEVTPGEHYRVVVTLAADAKPGYSRGTVEVKTNVAGESTLQIYIYAMIRP